MPVPVECLCGQRFAAEDRLVGQMVACPACSSALVIARPIAFEFYCPCGRAWQVDSRMVGKPFTCDQCGMRGEVPPPPPDPRPLTGASPLFPDELAAWLAAPVYIKETPTPQELSEFAKRTKIREPEKTAKPASNARKLMEQARKEVREQKFRLMMMSLDSMGRFIVRMAVAGISVIGGLLMFLLNPPSDHVSGFDIQVIFASLIVVNGLVWFYWGLTEE